MYGLYKVYKVRFYGNILNMIKNLITFNEHSIYVTARMFVHTTRITEMLGRFLNLNKMKTKRLSNHEAIFYSQ